MVWSLNSGKEGPVTFSTKASDIRKPPGTIISYRVKTQDRSSRTKMTVELEGWLLQDGEDSVKFVETDLDLVFGVVDKRICVLQLGYFTPSQVRFVAKPELCTLEGQPIDKHQLLGVRARSNSTSSLDAIECLDTLYGVSSDHSDDECDDANEAEDEDEANDCVRKVADQLAETTLEEEKRAPSLAKKCVNVGKKVLTSLAPKRHHRSSEDVTLTKVAEAGASSPNTVRLARTVEPCVVSMV
eukprot:m.285449 g.285449  ORF g.285449 m.285449 type:complete len:242 (-) comp19434_c3_seq1:2781-3506(-)